MATLTATDRRKLEQAVLDARQAAETGVRKRFASLDLSAPESPPGLSQDDRTLRTALRKRASDLGKGWEGPNQAYQEAVVKGVPFLVEELAYDTWHRMLFARFLAENDLLTHPGLGIPLSLADMSGLAAEEGGDPWELAAAFAAARLPGLFHLARPLRLATEDRQTLTALMTGLDAAIFTANDALGWVYQYWQAKRKDEVNAAGQKITGKTLPAVTQLFTEDYIVDFLLQNSLGAWYVARHPETPLRAEWPYLRFRDDGTPAAGTFPTWPESVDRVTVMDPCCGSGHFLVAAFHLLVAMRREAEGLDQAAAADAVLRDNLFGLELDARCTQIATFAVALEAWKLGGHPEANPPQIACSGIPVSGQKAAWQKLARGDTNLEIALTQLYDQFSQASELGSLIDPRKVALMPSTSRQGQYGFALQHEWGAVERRLHRALEQEQAGDPALRIFTAADDDLTGTLRAARLLSRTYTLVATNVPYLSRGSHGEALRDFADRTYPEAKSDLATLFLERCLGLVAGEDDAAGNPASAGTVALVTPQNWLFLGAYRKLRHMLLERDTLNLIARLGARAFRTITGEVVNVVLPILTATPPGPGHDFAGIDTSVASDADAKAALLRTGVLTFVDQRRQRENPDQRIILENLTKGILLEAYASSIKGLTTGDLPRFVQPFWESDCRSEDWSKFQSTIERSTIYGGRSLVFYWCNGKGPIHDQPGARTYATGAWGKFGVLVSQMGSLPVTIYTGDPHDNNTAVIVPKNPGHLPAIWAFCSSPEFNIAVRKIDAKLNVTNATLVKVPFDLVHWQRVAAERYPDGLPEPYSSDPTQWLFDGTVPGSDHPLQVVMARLAGYGWPEQAKDGLERMADPDGIICLPSVYQEPPAELRLRDLLAVAYGEAWSSDLLAGLLRQVGAASLDAWLRDKGRNGFFAQQVSLFHQRPFLWQITDGLRDGFSAIVNYHRLTNQALSKLIYTYLGDWIARQKRAADNGEAGAQARYEQATDLKARLEAILNGEPPYDIYVRWKPLAEQPIGWQPDLNDGVRLNIRPFIEAGVLAGKGNVKWGKDRGNDPVERAEPLLAETRNDDLRERIRRHTSTERHNDLHFTRDEKRRARELAAQER